MSCRLSIERVYWIIVFFAPLGWVFGPFGSSFSVFWPFLHHFWLSFDLYIERRTDQQGNICISRAPMELKLKMLIHIYFRIPSVAAWKAFKLESNNGVIFSKKEANLHWYINCENKPRLKNLPKYTKVSRQTRTGNHNPQSAPLTYRLVTQINLGLCDKAQSLDNSL